MTDSLGLLLLLRHGIVSHSPARICSKVMILP